MRWLVTGGLGFIGSHFIRLALRQHPTLELVNMDAMTYAANPANLRDVEGDRRYGFVKGDIRNEADVDAAIAGGVDAIVNFAAETHVDRSIVDPESFLRTDALGTLVLLQAAVKASVKRFLQVSTDEVYGDVTDGQSSEDDPVRPRSPYAASKASAELLSLAFHTTYGLPVVVTRGSNTYGPKQYPEKIVPLFVTNLIDDLPVPVYGDGLQIRDWLHVDDHARAILYVLEHAPPGNVYNVAGGASRTNLELTAVLTKLCGRSIDTHVTHVADRPGHDRRYALNAAKIYALGWRPVVPFADGIAQTVQWYRDNESWWRPLKNHYAKK